MNRSIFLTSFFGTQSSGVNPFTSPAIRQGYSEASKREIAPTPLFPWIKAFQFSSLPIPRGETIPSPVITTRRPMVFLVLLRRSSGVALDVPHRIADGMDLLGVLVA